MNKIIDSYETKKYYLELHENLNSDFPYGTYQHNKNPHTSGGGGPFKEYNKARAYFIKQLIKHFPNPLYKDKRFIIEHCDVNNMVVLKDNQGDRLWSNSITVLMEEIEKRKSSIEQMRLDL